MIGFLTFIAVLVISTDGSPQNFLTSRIAGGIDSSGIEEIPYQVDLHFNNKHYCGGIIVSEYYVLTAATCLSAGPISNYTIRSGSLYSDQPDATTHRVSRIIVHEDYHLNNLDIPIHDIALIQVTKTAPFILDGTRDCIPLSNRPPRMGSVGKISGWGWNSGRKLQVTEVKIYDTKSCNKTYEGALPYGQICAFSRGKDACKGDAGGPLVVGVHLVGIISWGKTCAGSYPGVYIDVYAYRGWITQNIGITKSC